MLTGMETLWKNRDWMNRLRHSRTGVLSHAASISPSGEHLVFALRREGVATTRLFAPEHGLWGAAQDMEGVEHQFDEIVQSEVTSLYGHDVDSLKPREAMLSGLDAVVIDVQDVGARYYTFAYTALFLAQAALERGIDVYVIDRPNPVNGTTLEGNLIDRGFESFVGVRSGMTRHGMTLCELIRMWCVQDGTPNLESLHLCWMEGYDRRSYFDETGVLWTMPSPNMPTLETAVVYPGMCLLEGTNLSEGRGTTRPFEIFGAPWVDANAAHRGVEALCLPGVVFRPVDFKPMFQKHAGQVCHGLQMYVTDRRRFRSVLTGIAVLSVMSALHAEFSWRSETYEFVRDILAIDLLFGNDTVRKQIEGQENPYRIVEGFDAQTESWRCLRREFLYYGEGE